MDAKVDDFVHAGSLEALEAEGHLLVRGRHRPVLVVRDGGRVFALDNRCPHMGFPLHRGSVEDGVLTCHWHHARFDLASGCTFDLWADDVPTCPVEIRDGEVWVKPVFERLDAAGYWRRRLDDGMAHNLGLVVAKAVSGMLRSGAAPRDILRAAALFGARNRDGWDVGQTILTALGALVAHLDDEDVELALFHGARRVAADCDGAPPYVPRAPLAGDAGGETPGADALARWLERWCQVRHRDGAERTLLTAIAGGATPARLADMLFAAECGRAFADGGHSLDFINKAFECLDLIGWEHAAAILPTVVGQMVAARGADERTAWRQPADLIALTEMAAADLSARFEAAPNKGKGAWHDHAALADEILGDDPKAILEAIVAAVDAGASPADLGRALAYAAALRVARFGSANEHGDWDTAHHAFTYCNAVHQALKRITARAPGDAPPPSAVRGVLHGAMAVYLARFLNVPPAPIPGDGGDDLNDLPDDPKDLRAALLDAFDRQRQVEAAGRIVARYLTLGHPPAGIIATLAHALLREDAGFHAYQMLEAAVRQFGEWPADEWGAARAEGRRILVAAARFLAAHSPTERARLQTADIARRLMRGETLHEDEDEREDAGEDEGEDAAADTTAT